MPIKATKNIIFKIFLFGIALLALIGMFTPKPKKVEPPKPTVSPKATPSKSTETKPESAKIEISGIKINNFYQQATETKEDGFAKFVDKKDYQIMYIPIDNSFLISITGSPFEEIRKQAEEDLLKTLDVDKENACHLNINITTPSYINPSFAGKVYKPSFCENK